MIVAKVEGPEAVDVEQRDAEGAAVALCSLDVELELGPEGAQREQIPGQRIAIAELRELGLELGDPSASIGKLGLEASAGPDTHHRPYRTRDQRP
jgi:hypothetical protein